MKSKIDNLGTEFENAKTELRTQALETKKNKDKIITLKEKNEDKEVTKTDL